MRKRVAFKDVGEEGGKGSLKNSCNNQSISCSDGSSSIGRNSDVSENTMEESGDGDEVQSSLKCPFDAAMEALEEVLPIRFQNLHLYVCLCVLEFSVFFLLLNS